MNKNALKQADFKLSGQCRVPVYSVGGTEGTYVQHVCIAYAMHGRHGALCTSHSHTCRKERLI